MIKRASARILFVLVTSAVLFSIYGAFRLYNYKQLSGSRQEMVNTHIATMNIRQPLVLQAMRAVPRHEFVLPSYSARAYENRALPIDEGQTISQPIIVALMSEHAQITKNEKVLEIGTGSGYQAAILSILADEVYTIEYLPPLGQKAAKTLKRLGYDNVHVRIGDGYQGWPEQAPFDAILVTAAIDHIPPALINQLAPGGRLVIPVGDPKTGQRLTVVSKDESGKISKQEVLPVSFVPFLGPNGGA
jgi:protein-L-isoaspartate(D-aspartate) O-methyltransferase